MIPTHTLAEKEKCLQIENYSVSLKHQIGLSGLHSSVQKCGVIGLSRHQIDVNFKNMTPDPPIKALLL